MLHTRDTQLMAQLAQGVLAGGRQFSKTKYGEYLETPKTWADFGFLPERA
jgi:hypothetical protein